MLIVLIFESCVVEFLCLRDAISRTQLAIHTDGASDPLFQHTFFGFDSSSAG